MGSYPSAEMQSVYSTALARWATEFLVPVWVTSMDQIELFNHLELFNYVQTNDC